MDGVAICLGVKCGWLSQLVCLPPPKKNQLPSFLLLFLLLVLRCAILFHCPLPTIQTWLVLSLSLSRSLSLSLTPPLTPYLSITHTHTPTCPCVLKKALLMLHRFSASSSRMWSSGRSLVVIAPRTTARASTCGRCNTLRTYSTDAPRSHVRGSRVRAMLH